LVMGVASSVRWYGCHGGKPVRGLVAPYRNAASMIPKIAVSPVIAVAMTTE
jgi:hypothetical protein